MHWALKFPRGMSPNCAPPDPSSFLHVSTSMLAPDAVVSTTNFLSNNETAIRGAVERTRTTTTDRAVNLEETVSNDPPAVAEQFDAIPTGTSQPSLHYQQQDHQEYSSSSSSSSSSSASLRSTVTISNREATSTTATAMEESTPTPATTPMAAVPGLTDIVATSFLLLRRINQSNMHEKAWGERFLKVQQFYIVNGHLMLPRDDPEYGKLRHWLARQRRKLPMSMPTYQLELLESINYKAGMRYPEGSGKKTKTARKDGGAKREEEAAPNDQESSGDDAPSSPNHHQEQQDRKEHSSTITAKEAATISATTENSFLLQGTPLVRRDRVWLEKFQKAKQFYKEHGHVNLPRDDPETKSLANWLRYQRKKGKSLRKDQLELLKSIVQEEQEQDPVEVSPPCLASVVAKTNTKDTITTSSTTFTRDKVWSEKFQKVKQYYKENGHLNLPSDNPETRTLADWLRYQRKKSKSLRKDQLEMLKSITHTNVVCRRDLEDDAWEEKYTHLKNMYETTGSSDIKISQDRALYDWVLHQKRKARSNLLDSRRRELLEKVGVDLTKFQFPKDGKYAERTAKWHTHFAKLKEYKQIHGDCNVPARYDKDPKLGQWVSKQRYKYGARTKEGKTVHTMDPDRVEKLNSIGFEWYGRTSQSHHWCHSIAST